MDPLGGAETYRVREFEACAPGRSSPWLTAAVLDLAMDAEGKSLTEVRLGSPTLHLDPGPDFLPPGAFHIPPGEEGLPRVEVFRGQITSRLPGGEGLRIFWGRDLRLTFEPGRDFNTRGFFDAPIGRFSLFGNILPSGQSSLRAKVERLDFTGTPAILGPAGPVKLSGKGAGALTFLFGPGRLPQLVGSLVLGRMTLEGAGIQFDESRLVIRGTQDGSWNPSLGLHAAKADWGGILVEGIELQLHPGSGRAVSGSATLWGGHLQLEGGMSPDFWGRGRLENADLTRMPPGLLGAATPTTGRMSAQFTLEEGRLGGKFQVREAALWSIRFLSGIRRKLPGVVPGGEGFETVKGRFTHANGVTVLPELELEGGGFGLRLSRPGRVGPDRQLDLEFVLNLEEERTGPGLPPLRKLLSTFRRELWKPFEKFIQFRIQIRGTLDAPIHQLRPPEAFGK
ncbi:MAG: translocation/assembly module TamB domain-containing protein [Planctomycetota bacterium]